MASLVLKNPLIEINKSEAEKLASALANVAKHYDFKVNPAVMAWVQLIGVGAAVYGPRIALTMSVKKAAKKEQAANQPIVSRETQPAQQAGMMRYQ